VKLTSTGWTLTRTFLPHLQHLPQTLLQEAMSQRPHADVSPNRDDEIDLEKEKVTHTEQVHNGNMTAEEANFLAKFSEDQRKAVVRKVDWRLVPMLLVSCK
jgi:hypothetical protein